MANPYDTLVPTSPASQFYGAAPGGEDEVAQDQQAAVTGRPPAYVTVGRHGVTARPFPGSAGGGTRSSTQQRPGAAPSAAPGFNEFADFYAKSNSTPDKPINLSSLSDEDWLGIGNEYAKHYVPGMLEGAGYKPDKPAIDEYTNHFMMELYRNLPAIKQHYAKQANAAPAAAAPSPTKELVSGALKQAAGEADVGLANVVKDLPNILEKYGQFSLPNVLNPLSSLKSSKAIYDKVANGEKLSLSDFMPGKPVSAETIGKVTNPLTKPIEKYLRQGGEQNLPGTKGSQITPEEQKALQDNPLTSAASQFAGGALPTLASAAGGPATMATVGAAQFGGQSRQEQEDRINGMSDADLNKIPEYQKLVAQTGDPAKAKQMLAHAASEAAGNVGELFGGIMNTFGGGALTKPVQAAIAKLVGQSALKRVLASSVAEAGGLTALGAGQQAATVSATNAATGEKREADLGEGAPSNALLGVLFGGLGALAHKPGAAPKPGAEGGKPNAPGATPAAGDAATPAYSQASAAVLADPEHAVKPGTSAEEAMPTMAEALDQFNARYAALHEGATPEEKAKASTQFQQDYKQKFGIQEAQPVTPQEGVISPAEAEAAVQPTEPATPPPEVRQAHEEAATVPGEVRTNAPEAEPLTTRDLVTQPGVDTALPFGVTEKVAEEFRAKNGRDPTPDEINREAHIVLEAAGIKLTDFVKREALGQLLEKNPNELPTKDEIDERARQINNKLHDEHYQKSINERLQAFSKHKPLENPTGDRLRQGLPEKERTFKDTNPLPKEHAAEPKEGEAAKQQTELHDLPQQERGAESFRAKIADAVKRGWLTQKHADLVNWLLDKNPKLAKDLGVEVIGPETLGGGRYKPLDRLVQIFSNGARETASVHEIMHHTERMMPEVVQDGIRRAWEKAVREAVAKATPERAQALKDLLQFNRDSEARGRVIDAQSQGHVNLENEYQLSNPSEYWAVNATRILSDRAFAKQNGWVAQAKQWLKEFTEHVKGVFGLDSDAPVLKALRSILKGEGEFQPGAQQIASREPTSLKFEQQPKPTAFKSLDEVRDAWHSTTPPTKEATAEAKESRMQSWATKHVNELKPLQYFNRALAKLGVTVTPDKDIFGSMTTLSDRAQFEQDHDSANYVEPALNKFVELAKSLGFKGKEGFKEFIAHATDAIAARHALERNKLLHYQTVRLTDAAEAQRAALLQDVFKGKLKPEEYMPQLKKIVNAPGAQIEKTGKRSGSGISDEMAYKLIENAKSAGITDEVANQINEALNPIRDRTLENGQRSKRYTPEQRAIQQAYGFKWYLPFKGFAEDTPMGVDGSRRPLGAFNKDTKYMEGRTTQANNPLENLLADLSASGRDVAYNETANTVFKAASDPAINRKLGAKIKSYNINRMTEDALAGGGKLSDMDSIFRSPNTVIFNNGEHRFSIEFPEDSRELEAIKSIQKENTLDGFSKGVGRLTNLYARAKTAYSPVFDLFTALVRDTSTYPLMASLDHGPAVVARYGANLVKFGGPLGAWRTYVGAFRGKSFAEIEARAKENPDSMAGWAYRLSKAGGGLEFRQELNNVKKADDIAEKMAKQSTSALSSPKQLGKNFLSFLDSFATASIATGRVSMFKALVESGVSESEAALYTKRLLNFQQTSEGSRRMNAYFAFWRAGIANADRLYEFVHKADGTFDRAKFGKIVGLGVAAAAAWNGVLKAYYGDDAKKLTQDTLSKNFVLPVEYNGEPIKLPMGLGLPRLMLGLGMLATRMVEGDASMKDTLEATKNTIFENLTPLKPSQSKENATAGERAMDLLMAAVPSPVRPVAELERNQSIFGRTITPTPDARDNKFRSDSGFRSTPEQWKDLAKGIHNISGVDVFPESLEYLSNSYGAGFMTELLRGFVLQNKEEQGKETGLTDYPFVPRFTTGDIKYAGAREFYEQRDQLKNAVKEANALKADNKPIPNALQKQVDKGKQFESVQRAHSKAIKEIEINTLLSASAKAAQLTRENDRFKKEQERMVK